MISDNDAYNRFYQFIGQAEINNILHKKGYEDIRITRQFMSLNEEENRHTNRVRFINKKVICYTFRRRHTIPIHLITVI